MNTVFNRLLKVSKVRTLYTNWAATGSSVLSCPIFQICIHFCLQKTSKIRSDNGKASDCRRPFTTSSSSKLASL